MAAEIRKLNEAQKIAITVYGDGDYKWLLDEADPIQKIKNENLGDGLFTFLMVELDSFDGGNDLEVAHYRVDRAINDLHVVANALAQTLYSQTYQPC